MVVVGGGLTFLEGLLGRSAQLATDVLEPLLKLLLLLAYLLLLGLARKLVFGGCTRGGNRRGCTSTDHQGVSSRFKNVNALFAIFPVQQYLINVEDYTPAHNKLTNCGG